MRGHVFLFGLNRLLRFHILWIWLCRGKLKFSWLRFRGLVWNFCLWFFRNSDEFRLLHNCLNYSRVNASFGFFLDHLSRLNFEFFWLLRILYFIHSSLVFAHEWRLAYILSILLITLGKAAWIVGINRIKVLRILVWMHFYMLVIWFRIGHYFALFRSLAWKNEGWNTHANRCWGYQTSEVLALVVVFYVWCKFFIGKLCDPYRNYWYFCPLLSEFLKLFFSQRWLEGFSETFDCLFVWFRRIGSFLIMWKNPSLRANWLLWVNLFGRLLVPLRRLHLFGPLGFDKTILTWKALETVIVHITLYLSLRESVLVWAIFLKVILWTQRDDLGLNTMIGYLHLCTLSGSDFWFLCIQIDWENIYLLICFVFLFSLQLSWLSISIFLVFWIYCVLWFLWIPLII